MSDQIPEVPPGPIRKEVPTSLSYIVGRDLAGEPFGTVVKWASPVTLSVEMLLMAGRITEEQAIAMGWTPPPPVPWWRRARWAVELWWFDHRPTLHLGPCNHEDCL